MMMMMMIHQEEEDEEQGEIKREAIVHIKLRRVEKIGETGEAGENKKFK
jgi:hypothetical protein